jgi:hypothetical protein
MRLIHTEMLELRIQGRINSTVRYSFAYFDGRQRDIPRQYAVSQLLYRTRPRDQNVRVNLQPRISPITCDIIA